MVKINVDEVKKYLDIITNLLSKYREKHEKIEFEYNNMVLNWKNNKAPVFFALINDNQLLNIKLICTLESEIKVLSRVINKYLEIATKIECNLEQKDYLISKFDNVLNKIDNILTKFNELGDISFCSNKLNILNEKSKLKSDKANIESIKDKIKEKYSYIEQVEKDLNSFSVEDINISIKNELLIPKKVVDNYKFNIDEVRVSNKKLIAYFNSQADIMSKIKANFNEMSKYYTSKSFSNLLQYNESIFSNLENVNQINKKIYRNINDICDDYEQMIIQNINNLEGLK